MRRGLSLSLAVAFATLVFCSVVSPSRAHAYAWLIRHGYTACAMCHVDPSGGSLLTPYGRAQGTLLMAARWGSTDDEAAVKQGEFLFGAFEMPEFLQLGADFRGGALATSMSGGPLPSTMTDSRVLLMQADLEAGLSIDRFRAAGSLGFATDGAFGATIVSFGTQVGDENPPRLVSRAHWLGVSLGEDNEWLLRAGRINVPFGVRTIEHTSWIRKDTRTDINDSQQDGIALAYNGEKWRGEALAILGNYQLGPDAYRERGGSAYVEFTPTEGLGFGLSSLVVHSNTDLRLQTPLWRQAHGAFVRYSPALWFVLLAEADFLVSSQPQYNAFGVSTWVQADFEPTQGLHIIPTVEFKAPDFGAPSASIGGSLGVAWFFLPHIDIRVDAGLQSVATPGAPSGGGSSVTAQSILAQLHAYL
jgi:hypothetical protein